MIPHSRPTIQSEDIQAITSALSSGFISEGPMVSQLEDAFTKKFGAGAALAVGSGSQALLLSLKILNVAPGTEVILPTYVCPEVLSGVEALGAKPVLVDVERDYTISECSVESAVTENTAAIIVPYVMGIWRDVSSLQSLGVPIVEDCSQFIYHPTIPDARIFGDLVVFSFHATKLIAGGEGGLVLAINPRYRDALGSQKSFRDTPYKVNFYPMTDIQAALVVAQLNRFSCFVKRRQQIADAYFDALKHLHCVELPWSLRGRSIFFRFPVHLSEANEQTIDEVIETFRVLGVSVRRPVDTLLHQLCPDLKNGVFPVAEELFRETVSIPIYPSLSEEEFDSVVIAVNKVFS